MLKRIAGSLGTTSQTLLLTMFLFLFGVTARPCAAGGSPRSHDGGFFLRLSAGGGSAETKLEPGGSSAGDVKLSGFAGDYNFAVGGIVAENLALHGTFFGWSISDPDVDLFGAMGTFKNSTLTMGGLGGGITYYVMPANVYLSPSIGFGILSLDDSETDPGFALDATIGKEWWVGQSWGLGLAGSFGYHSIPDSEVNSSWKGPSFGLRFSATLN